MIFPVTPTYVRGPIKTGLMRPIIAYLPLTGKVLEGVPLLPELEETAKSFLTKDLELYESIIDGEHSYNMGMNFLENIYNAGKAAGGYTEEDMRIIFGLGAANNANGSPSFEEALNSLKPIPIAFEAEIYINSDNLKIENNILQGKYKY